MERKEGIEPPLFEKNNVPCYCLLDMSTKELIKEIERTEKKTALLQAKLFRASEDQGEYLRLAAVLRSTAGVLRGKIKGSAVAWQRKIRKEWDR